MSPETDKRTGGHVFIVRGKVQDLACDAWSISCDHNAKPTRKESWLPKHILDRQPSYEWPERPSGWGHDGVRVARLTNWPDQEGPQPYLLHVGSHPEEKIEWFVEGAVQFFEEVAKDLKGRNPLYNRAKHLVALPAVGSGRGGLGHRAGEVACRLLPALYESAKKHDLDVALVLLDAPAFAAAQAVRCTLSDETIWSAELTGELRQTAKELACHASQGKLALFLGAGVSNSAGLPLWGDLLDQLAKVANIVDADWEEVTKLKLSVLDQAAIIERRLGSQAKLGKAISDILLKYHGYSLTHALLAGLPVREAVTTNFDNLFEDAWTEHGADGTSNRPPVLPYEIGPDLDRWLLKLHGCVTRPEDIVFTRADFMRYAEQRGALTGVVQTLLITRHLLIVGFSLDDPNFHEIVDAVRRVLGRRNQKDGKNPLLGTALMTESRPSVADLYSGELEWVSTGQSPTFNAEASRLQQIFLDYLSSRVRDPSRLVHLLNERYRDVLTEDERALAQTLKDLGQGLSNSDRSAPAWDAVREWLASLGYPFPTETS